VYTFQLSHNRVGRIPMEATREWRFGIRQIPEWRHQHLLRALFEMCHHGEPRMNSRSTSRRRLVAVGLFLILALAGHSPISNAQGKLPGAMPEVDVFPASLAVSPDGAATQLLVILRNPGEGAIRQIEVSWLADSGVTVLPAQPLILSSLAPHSDTSWVLQVSQSQIEPIDGSVRLRVAYRDSSGSKIIAQSIPVKSREPVTIDKFLDTKIQTTLDSLDSSHSGTIDLFLTNKQGIEITLDVRASGPDFICFNPVNKSCPKEGSTDATQAATTSPSKVHLAPIVIGPYQTHEEVFDVGAKDRVEPGKYLLSFEIALQANGAKTSARSTVITQTVDVGVVGESAILKALSVPSFLMLPGCLVMLTFFFLDKYGPAWSKPAKVPDAPSALDPYLWLASITISGLMAVVYRWIFHRWYFVRYGIQDIAVIWVVAVALGIILYASIFGVPRFLQNKRTPTENDGPIKVLERLGWQRQKLIANRYTLAQGDAKKIVVAISKPSDDGKNIWVSPTINVNVEAAKTELQPRILKELESTGKPGKLADLLRATPGIATWDQTSIGSPRFLPIGTDSLTYLDQAVIANQKSPDG